MTYKKFLISLNEPKIHSLDTFNANIDLEVKEAHYLLSTSGSAEKKYYLHSLDGIKKAVESFFKSHPQDSTDRWWVSLSTKHVAGFSILARSFFGGLKKPFEDSFVLDVELMRRESITILSLVPTQIFDIVSKKVVAPSQLKYVFVGGAPLSSELFEDAKKLGWPIIACFGATETFAQFASSNNNLDYKTYQGWDVQSNSHKELMVRGESLFSHQIFENGVFLKRKSEWINLKDKVSLADNSFSFLQKSDFRYKSKGSFIDFTKQKKTFENFLLNNKLDRNKSLLLVLEEERSGAGLYVVTSEIECAQSAFSFLPELRGSFLLKDISFLLNEIGKPVKSRIESALSRPLLLS